MTKKFICPNGCTYIINQKNVRIAELEEARDNACNDCDMWRSKCDEILSQVQDDGWTGTQYELAVRITKALQEQTDE